ncbi:ABC transporter substrate-binding protein [Nocardia flavorosea]|uniref:ABC transporter substrate-binding protein n=1 Tax=Nocardia flavorosea TaxID=53429 RepID=UPI001E58F79A|nr:ABC transporter substrate-binding protein [Nocardia flavorosea]
MKLEKCRLIRLMATAAVGAIALTGCANSGTPGQDNGSSAASAAHGPIGDQGDPGPPVEGGTLSFATYSPVSSLDPTVTVATGPTGGTELAAVYDVLMRYDYDSQTFEPQLAQSLQESPDRLTWTMRLREGVRFSDGTPFDAHAVVASIERYNTRRGLYAPLYTKMVHSTTAKDATTVEFRLEQPWSNFPAILAYGHGMIVAPSSQQGDTFTPIGAGPFSVVNLRPQQELELKARSDYWGGAPHLDGLKFVAIAGEQPKIEALRTGGVQMIYLRNAETVNAATAEFPGFVSTYSMTTIGQINSAPGRPGADRRVRQAMAYAIDTDILNQRARGGQEIMGTDLFQPWSQWHGDTTGITPDPVKAKQLLDQAVADGFDGKVTYVGINDPDAQEVALAVQAQLNAVGFDASIEYAGSVPDMVRRLYADRNFDIALGGYNVSDIDPEIRLFNALHSTSKNLVGLQSPVMDGLLGDVLSAPDTETKQHALDEIQRFINEQQSFLTWGAGRTYVAWSDNVFGADPSIDQIMLFDEAFIRD